MDEEGYLYFVSRKDDLIKTKGERVSPKEIEGVLCDMEGVLEAGAIGVPDEIAGQAVKAFICFEKGNERTEEDILKHCAMHLEPFMMPKYFELRQSLPKLANGKIDKKSLSQNP